MASVAEAFRRGWTIGECYLDLRLTSCGQVRTATVLVWTTYEAVAVAACVVCACVNVCTHTRTRGCVCVCVQYALRNSG